MFIIAAICAALTIYFGIGIILFGYIIGEEGVLKPSNVKNLKDVPYCLFLIVLFCLCFFAWPYAAYLVYTDANENNN